MLRMRSALAGAVNFPNASNTGWTPPPAMYTPGGAINTTYHASDANTALGVSLNAGWSITYNGSGVGAWTIPEGSYLYGVSLQTPGVPVGFDSITVDSCSLGQVAFPPGSTVSTALVTNCLVTNIHGGDSQCIIFSGTATDVLITGCTLTGADSRAQRVDSGIAVNGSSTATIEACDISWMRVGINISTGTVQDCYIHDFGFTSTDHTDGIFVPATPQGPVIQHNTILMQLTETSPVFTDHTLAGSSKAINSLTVTGNLLAGGSYGIYAGGDSSTRASCVLSSSSTTASCVNAATGDLYAYVTDGGVNIADGTQITAVTPGTGYTLSQEPTGSATETVTLHFGNGIVITDNRFSAMFFPGVGSSGTVSSWDSGGYQNTWAGNVIHETSAPVAS